MVNKPIVRPAGGRRGLLLLHITGRREIRAARDEIGKEVQAYGAWWDVIHAICCRMWGVG